MSLPASVADVLTNHVSLEVECIDRMYLNLYQPKLVYPAGVVGFFKAHRGMPFVSSALMDPISKGFVVGIHRFVKDRGLDLVHFTKGQRKDDVATGTWPPTTAPRGSSSSAEPRRSATSSAPRSESTPRRASATPGS